MAIKRTYRTSGVNTDGTSVLAATPKKKSKSKKLWTAIGIGALAIGGLAAYGGWGFGQGGTFLSSLKGGWGKLFGSAASISGGAAPALGGAGPVRGSLRTALTTQNTTALAGTAAASGGTTLGSLGTGLKGYFSNITSGQAMLASTGLNTLGALFDTSDEDMLAFNTAQHEDIMDYRYANLAAEEAAAKALQEGKNRDTAIASTFMGHTSPITGNVEGVSGVTPGYIPKPSKIYPEFHPTGGLISAGSVA